MNYVSLEDVLKLSKLYEARSAYKDWCAEYERIDNEIEKLLISMCANAIEVDNDKES